MKIQEALKETGKAQHKDFPNLFVEVGTGGFLNWYVKSNSARQEGRVKYAAIISDDWQPYHPIDCTCRDCVNEEEVEPEGHPVVYCEKKWGCEWQGFALHHGLGWGPILHHDLWRQKHSKKCGGKFIEAVI